ncbi:hypothetical protein H5410_052880 [Solanum commersonii]|uniref:Uncharacterized protein n=1 Tax=Solanum commersonii TaxID=4109 RepID=A0A9J5X4C2_SOLCO|nr:hypothetical protein H5410_052880 [Solanum commersonii]
MRSCPVLELNLQNVFAVIPLNLTLLNRFSTLEVLPESSRDSAYSIYSVGSSGNSAAAILYSVENFGNSAAAICYNTVLEILERVELFYNFYRVKNSGKSLCGKKLKRLKQNEKNESINNTKEKGFESKQSSKSIEESDIDMQYRSSAELANKFKIKREQLANERYDRAKKK